MGLYRIEHVQLDRGLTCADLWTNERLEVSEQKLTHGVKPNWVIAVRTLAGIRPAIWRRVEIPSDAKLPFVSRVLIATMG